MSDFNKPVLTSTYVNFIAEINDKFSDVAKGLDPAVCSPINQPTNAFRWSSAAAKWQKWNGTAWVDPVSKYAINISGVADTATIALACSGNSATATTAAACSGNSATATTAAACSGNSATATISAGCSGNAATASAAVTAAACSGNSATATNATNATNATYLSSNIQNNIIIGKLQSMSMSGTGGDTSFTCRATGTGDGNLAGIAFHNDNYAIKMGVRGDGYLGIGGWSRPAWSWYTDPSGNMVAAGNVTAYSDPRLKENFKKVENPLEILSKLDGGTFDWKHGIPHTECKAGMHDYGILADQVQAVMPEVVSESVEIDGMKYKVVAYEKLVPVLIEAIKELNKRLKEIEGI